MKRLRLYYHLLRYWMHRNFDAMVILCVYAMLFLMGVEMYIFRMAR